MTNADYKSPMLGTAQWGWTVSRSEALELLDAWLSTGHKNIDLATNYPINKNPSDFRKAEKILLEYIQAHGLTDLDVTMKIGSQDNMRSPDINLEPSFILMIAMEYQRLFGTNLKGIMVHWDNRSDEHEIAQSLEALAELKHSNGLRPGLSGIKHPELYATANQEFNLNFDIQIKHNIFQSDYQRYAAFFSKANNAQHRFFAYGLNAGGVKLEGPYPTGSTFVARGGDPAKMMPLLDQIRERIPIWNTAFVRPPVQSMNHIGLIYAGLHPGITGPVWGLSSTAQLQKTLDFWRNLGTFDYSDVFADLQKKANNYAHGTI